MTVATANSYLVELREYVTWQDQMIRELRAELTTQRNTVRLLEGKLDEMVHEWTQEEGQREGS